MLSANTLHPLSEQVCSTSVSPVHLSVLAPVEVDATGTDVVALDCEDEVDSGWEVEDNAVVEGDSEVTSEELDVVSGAVGLQ
jgi:hypothetical protein